MLVLLWRPLRPYFTILSGFCLYALQLLNRVFYSLKDTVTPVLTGLAAITMNITLSILWVQPLGHEGLALAYSIAGIFNLILLMVLVRRRLGPIGGGKLARSFLVSGVASLLMYCGARYGATMVGSWLSLHQAQCIYSNGRNGTWGSNLV